MKFSILFVMLIGLVGCSGPKSDEERLKLLVPDAQTTFPVSGKVLVDGKPVPYLWVKLHPKNPKPGALTPMGQTDRNGDFQVKTYLNGDGAPNGDYTVTIEWLHETVVGEWVGPSKLDGVCGSPKTSQFSAIVEGQPVTLPTYEVRARPDADKLQPQRVRDGF